MEYTELINKRRSIRKYDLSKPVSEKVLSKVLEAARLAPSACNIQPVHLIVIRDKKVKEELKEAYSREWFFTAPVIIAGCVDIEAAWKRSYDNFNAAFVDLTIAFDHLILAAANEGLGTCWVCAFNPAVAEKILRVPSNIKVVALTPLGFPAGEPAVRIRKELKEMVHYEKF